MANINEANYKGLTSTQISWSAAAASNTIGLDGGDHRAVLLVNNLSTEVICRVKVSAGDGILSDLGDLEVDLAISKIAAIPLGESMRFKTNTTQSVTFALTDTADTALTAGDLANVKVALLQG